MKGYINTTQNNIHYKGKVYITPGDRLGKNICLDTGRPELKVIAFVPEVTDEIVKSSIEAMGYNSSDWLN